jgi:hypothetical protein
MGKQKNETVIRRDIGTALKNRITKIGIVGEK